MERASSSEPTILHSARQYWDAFRSHRGFVGAARSLSALLWEFAIDSLPSRKRLRFGDADYDGEYPGQYHQRSREVEGTSAREVPLGIPADRTVGLPRNDGVAARTEPLRIRRLHLRRSRFGKRTNAPNGASDYPFRKIIGVELLSALNQIAEENIGKYRSDSQQCFDLANGLRRCRRI